MRSFWSIKLRTTRIGGNKVSGTVLLHVGETFVGCPPCPNGLAWTVG
jgi:hypothetical protein